MQHVQDAVLIDLILQCYTSGGALLGAHLGLEESLCSA